MSVRHFVIVKDGKIIGIYDDVPQATECFLSQNADGMEKAESIEDVTRILNKYVKANLKDDIQEAAQRLWKYIREGCDEVGRRLKDYDLRESFQQASADYLKKAEAEIERLKTLGGEVISNLTGLLDELSGVKKDDDKDRKDSGGGEKSA